METDKAIEILSDSCDRGMTTLNDDFKDAVSMGRDALKAVRNFYQAATWEAGMVILRDIGARTGMPAGTTRPARCCAEPSCGSITGRGNCRNCDASCQGCYYHHI